MMTPVAAESDAMVQLEIHKGNTAKQGLPFHYTIWPGKAACQSESEHGFASQKSHWKLTGCWLGFCVCFFFFKQGSDLSWPIPQEAMSHHWIAVLVWKVKTVRWPPTAPLSEETNPSGAWDEGANSKVLPTGWVSGFWHLQPSPKSWSSSQTVRRIRISGRYVGSRAAVWVCLLPMGGREAGREAVPCQRPEGNRGSQFGLHGKIYTTEPTSICNRKRKVSFTLLENCLVQPVVYTTCCFCCQSLLAQKFGYYPAERNLVITQLNRIWFSYSSGNEGKYFCPKKILNHYENHYNLLQNLFMTQTLNAGERNENNQPKSTAVWMCHVKSL